MAKKKTKKKEIEEIKVENEEKQEEVIKIENNGEELLYCKIK